MKKAILLIIFALFSIFTFAQEKIVWLGVAPRFGYGTSYFVNTRQIFQDENIVISPFTPSMSYGGRFSLGFGDGSISLSLEVMKNTYNQLFTVVDSSNKVNPYSASLSTLSSSLLFKVYSLTGFYFEFGPQIQQLQRAMLNNTGITEHIKPRFFAGEFGLGFMPLISQMFEISLGIRGVVSTGSIMADDFNLYSSSPNYSASVGNNTLLVSFMPMIDVNFVFGKMGRASCGAFRIMFNSNGMRKVRIRR